jgi:site-specific recombinase XerC
VITQQNDLQAAAPPSTRRAHTYKRHDHLLQAAVPRIGERDGLPVEQILGLFPSLPNWPDETRYKNWGYYRARRMMTDGARAILEWLLTYPGDGWQARWVASDADKSTSWASSVPVPGGAPGTVPRQEVMNGLASLLLCRVVAPSYEFQASYRAFRLFAYAQQVFRPDLFSAMRAAAAGQGAEGLALTGALTIICKIIMHTGRDANELTADDLLAYRAWCLQRHETTSFISLAWNLLRGIADLGGYHSITDALRYGQRPTAELVDAHRIQCQPVRDMLVRYFEERRPGLDYSSLAGLVRIVAGTFWADIERHHSGIDSLRLPADAATAWKQRLRTVTRKDGTTRPRKGHLDILVTIRGFYLDLQEWALEDPSWAQWAVPSPVSKAETAGHMKARRKTESEMHQRVRDRLPRLPALVDTAERHKAQQAALLEAATPVPFGNEFTHEGRQYRRAAPSSYGTSHYYWGENTAPVLVEDTATGEQANVTDGEDEAFWAWAIIEVLRHTGVRVEELLEITHLALVSYKLPDTGEIVPMLQIVPSKANQERLLLVSPELASVLASMVTRLRKQNNGSIPLTPRYDKTERTAGPPLPHLFQRRRGWEWAVPSANTVQELLNRTLERTGIRDAAGQPLHYTPHDFRRMFATEAVTGGLPVHIVARLLGHANINTTQAYMAVFDEDLVRSYRSFLDRRRGLRPEAEYREPTDEEWREFQQHFQTRKLELGECGRPYGAPCKHEHACIRCPSLRLDPKARPRLAEIIANLKDRIQEARLNGWLGEVEGLTTSRDAAARKLTSLDRMQQRQPALPPGAISLPVIVETSR